jgi:beta-lactamase class A
MNLQEKIQKNLPKNEIEFGIAVEHIESGEITGINSEAVFPTASVFKVPLMVEVYRQARLGKFSLDDRLELKSKYKTLTTGILLDLQDGLQPTIRDLAMLMTIVSDNTATAMLLERVGAENVTQSMHELGLQSMSVVMNVHEMFLYAFGIPERKDISLEELTEVASRVQMDYGSLTFSRKPDNNVSSASDMTRLMSLIFRSQVVDEPACREMLAILQEQQYNNRVSRYLPWRTVYHKTGTMRGLRNDSGILTCRGGSHAAFSVFSFDPVTLPLNDNRLPAQRSEMVEELMGEIGLAIYEHYQ